MFCFENADTLLIVYVSLLITSSQFKLSIVEIYQIFSQELLTKLSRSLKNSHTFQKVLTDLDNLDSLAISSQQVLE